jgi:hypothetical protein
MHVLIRKKKTLNIPTFAHHCRHYSWFFVLVLCLPLPSLSVQLMVRSSALLPRPTWSSMGVLTLYSYACTPASSSATIVFTGTGTSDSVGAFLDNVSPTQVPGPLPLLGVGVAFGLSRQLRRRFLHEPAKRRHTVGGSGVSPTSARAPVVLPIRAAREAGSAPSHSPLPAIRSAPLHSDPLPSAPPPAKESPGPPAPPARPPPPAAPGGGCGRWWPCARSRRSRRGLRGD